MELFGDDLLRIVFNIICSHEAIRSLLIFQVVGAHGGEKVQCMAMGGNGVLYTGGDDKMIRAWLPSTLEPLPGFEPLEVGPSVRQRGEIIIIVTPSLPPAGLPFLSYGPQSPNNNDDLPCLRHMAAQYEPWLRVSRSCWSRGTPTASSTSSRSRTSRTSDQQPLSPARRHWARHRRMSRTWWRTSLPRPQPLEPPSPSPELQMLIMPLSRELINPP